MGRPKGSKSRDILDPGNIIPSRRSEEPMQESSLSNSTESLKKSKKSKAKTRQNFKDSTSFNNLVGPKIEAFPHTKLPKNKLILQRYMSLRDQFCNKTVTALISIIFSELCEIWNLSRIPMKPERACKKIIGKVIDKFISMKHLSAKKIKENKVKEFIEDIDKLCDLAPPKPKLYEILKANLK